MDELKQYRDHTLAVIRSRVTRLVPRKLTEHEMLVLALTCAMRDHVDLVCINYGGKFGKELERLWATNRPESESADNSYAYLSIRPGELGVLFGADAMALDASKSDKTRSAQLTSFESVQGDAKVNVVQDLSQALCYTLASQRMCDAWQRPPMRCAAAISTRMTHSHDALRAIVGDLARSDARRIDALMEKIIIQDQASSARLTVLAEAISALAQTVVE